MIAVQLIIVVCKLGDRWAQAADGQDQVIDDSRDDGSGGALAPRRQWRSPRCTAHSRHYQAECPAAACQEMKLLSEGAPGPPGGSPSSTVYHCFFEADS